MLGYVAGMNVVVIAAVKMIVSSSEKKLGKRIDDLWSAFDRHGHKDLNGNGARVTR